MNPKKNRRLRFSFFCQFAPWNLGFEHSHNRRMISTLKMVPNLRFQSGTLIFWATIRWTCENSITQKLIHHRSLTARPWKPWWLEDDLSYWERNFSDLTYSSIRFRHYFLNAQKDQWTPAKKESFKLVRFWTTWFNNFEKPQKHTC